MRTVNDTSLEDYFELEEHDKKAFNSPKAKRYDKLLAEIRLKHGYQPYYGDNSILQDYDEIYNNVCLILPPMNEHERHIFNYSSFWGRAEHRTYRQFVDTSLKPTAPDYVHVQTDSITGSPVITFIPRPETGEGCKQINTHHDDIYILCSAENMPYVVFWVNANVLKHADCHECEKAPTYYSTGIDLLIPELSPIHFETFYSQEVLKNIQS